MTRIGAKATLLPGLALIAAGLPCSPGCRCTDVFCPTCSRGWLLFGIGAGLAFTPSIALAMADAAPADTGLASGLANVSMQMGAAIGIAVLASISTSPAHGPCWGPAPGATPPWPAATTWAISSPPAASWPPFVLAAVVLEGPNIGKAQTHRTTDLAAHGRGRDGL
jgi:MFS family permease